MPIFILIFFLLVFGYALLIDYYRRAWTLILECDATNKNPSVSISVIIAARNEEANIEALINSLAGQTYPKQLFEVIVVDDHSEDRTWELIQQNAIALSLKCIRLKDRVRPDENLRSYKKRAIEEGISLATGELIVTTDADCRFEPEWLRTIAAFHDETNAK